MKRVIRACCRSIQSEEVYHSHVHRVARSDPVGGALRGEDIISDKNHKGEDLNGMIQGPEVHKGNGNRDPNRLHCLTWLVPVPDYTVQLLTFRIMISSS